MYFNIHGNYCFPLVPRRDAKISTLCGFFAKNIDILHKICIIVSLFSAINYPILRSVMCRILH